MISPGCPILFKNAKVNLKAKKRERKKRMRKNKNLGFIYNLIIRHQVFQVTQRAYLIGETLFLIH